MECIEKNLKEKCVSPVDVLANETFNVRDFINKGGSWSEAFDEFAYTDCATGHHALLNATEDIFNTEIKTPEKWQSLIGININKCEHSFYVALQEKYLLTLESILNNNGKYSDLLLINPSDLGLPDTWKDEMGNLRTKKDMIFEAIGIYIATKRSNSFLDMSLPEVTPLGIIKKFDVPVEAVPLVLEAFKQYSF